MRKALLGLAAVILAAPAVPAAAQTTADRADARCVLVLNVVARDPKNREAAAQGTFYYLGKLKARGLGARLEPLLLEEGKTIKGADMMQAELTRCGKELNASSAALRTAYQDLQQQATKTAPPVAPAVPPKK